MYHISIRRRKSKRGSKHCSFDRLRSASLVNVLEEQYEHDSSEWWNDAVVVAHLADSRLKTVIYRQPDTGVPHSEC